MNNLSRSSYIPFYERNKHRNNPWYKTEKGIFFIVACALILLAGSVYMVYKMQAPESNIRSRNKNVNAPIALNIENPRADENNQNQTEFIDENNQNQTEVIYPVNEVASAANSSTDNWALNENINETNTYQSIAEPETQTTEGYQNEPEICEPEAQNQGSQPELEFEHQQIALPEENEVIDKIFFFNNSNNVLMSTNPEGSELITWRNVTDVPDLHSFDFAHVDNVVFFTDMEQTSVKLLDLNYPDDEPQVIITIIEFSIRKFLNISASSDGKLILTQTNLRFDDPEAPESPSVDLFETDDGIEWNLKFSYGITLNYKARFTTLKDSKDSFVYVQGDDSDSEKFICTVNLLDSLHHNNCTKVESMSANDKFLKFSRNTVYFAYWNELNTKLYVSKCDGHEIIAEFDVGSNLVIHQWINEDIYISFSETDSNSDISKLYKISLEDKSITLVGNTGINVTDGIIIQEDNLPQLEEEKDDGIIEDILAQLEEEVDNLPLLEEEEVDNSPHLEEDEADNLDMNSNDQNNSDDEEKILFYKRNPEVLLSTNPGGTKILTWERVTRVPLKVSYSADGNTAYYCNHSNNDVMSLDLSLDPAVSEPQMIFNVDPYDGSISNMSVSSDGKSILVILFKMPVSGEILLRYQLYETEDGKNWTPKYEDPIQLNHFASYVTLTPSKESIVYTHNTHSSEGKFICTVDLTDSLHLYRCKKVKSMRGRDNFIGISPDAAYFMYTRPAKQKCFLVKREGHEIVAEIDNGRFFNIHKWVNDGVYISFTRRGSVISKLYKLSFNDGSLTLIGKKGINIDKGVFITEEEDNFSQLEEEIEELEEDDDEEEEEVEVEEEEEQVEEVEETPIVENEKVHDVNNTVFESLGRWFRRFL